MTDPLDVINALKDIGSLDGKCYEVHRLLKVVFPKASAWYDDNHVITRINGKFYDKTGEVKHKPYIPITGNRLDERFGYRCDKKNIGDRHE